MLNETEEKRAQEVFACEARKTNDWKHALHAALIDLDGRRVFDGRKEAAALPRPLLDKYRVVFTAVCERVGASTAITFSLDRAGPSRPEVTARGVVVGLLTDAGYTAREIADGTGIGRSVVANCKEFRCNRPQWVELISEFSSQLPPARAR